jgi:hypothetical protein
VHLALHQASPREVVAQLLSGEADIVFPLNTTRIAVRRGHYLRGYGYRFIEQCAPELDEMTVRRALNSERDAAPA